VTGRALLALLSDGAAAGREETVTAGGMSCLEHENHYFAGDLSVLALAPSWEVSDQDPGELCVMPDPAGHPFCLCRWQVPPTIHSMNTPEPLDND
jgi:hypothetical protein